MPMAHLVADLVEEDDLAVQVKDETQVDVAASVKMAEAMEENLHLAKTAEDQDVQAKANLAEAEVVTRAVETAEILHVAKELLSHAHEQVRQVYTRRIKSSNF